MIYPWQQSQWQSFNQQIASQRLPHALLLTGTQGLGKLNLAQEMAKSVLCTDNTSSQACQHCHSCHLFAAGSHPDHNLIQPEEAGKQIKIEQIRQLKAKQQLTPTVSKWKTVIIEPADKMNISSSNSLLKLLEEPQKDTLLILISSQAQRLPITILSRCQKVLLNPPSSDDASKWLQANSQFDHNVITKILALSQGAPLKTLALLDTDIIEQIQQLDIDFDLLLTGKVNPVILAKQWLKYDLIMVFNYFQQHIKIRLIDSHNTAKLTLSRRYCFLYDCVIKAIKLVLSSNNPNKTLLIEQFMVSVMDDKWDNNSPSINT